nr:hypothetical protein [Tanacetum cinerariifolium]
MHLVLVAGGDEVMMMVLRGWRRLWTGTKGVAARGGEWCGGSSRSASVMWCGAGEGDEVVWPVVDGDEGEGGGGYGGGFGGGGGAWWRVVWWI